MRLTGCALALLLTAGCEPGNRSASIARPAAPGGLPGFSGLAPSPVPSVSLGALGAKKPLSAAYRGAYEFSTDVFTWNIPIWEKALAPFRGKPGLRYLEVGVFEGGSVLWMLQNVLTDPGASATVIDVFEGDLKRRFLANLKKSGDERKVTVIGGYSQVELRRQPLDGFDVVYIDGSHSADDVLEDAVLSWRLLKPGGLLIFDDYAWRPGSPHPSDWPGPGIQIFYTLYGRRFDVVHNGYQLILRRRTEAPAGDGHLPPPKG
jgi:hypothetical protein